jgi:hypothetical protein
MGIMALALVSGLEYCHINSPWQIRGICNAALARIVLQNEKLFVEEDNLAAIWNLYFLLGSASQSSTIFPDRIVIIKVILEFQLG